MYKLHTNCRACGFGPATYAPGTKHGQNEDRLIKVLDLGLQPLANDFCTDVDPRAGFAPLEVMLCPNCSLAQLSVVVDPKAMYSTYPYVTSKSNMMQEHFERIWTDCSRMAANKKVVEIGSNDGDFLVWCLKHGAELALGIDPAENLCKIAQGKGASSFCGLFDQVTACQVKSLCPEPGIVFARHVFCHVADWIGFMRALEELCTDQTIVCIEVPYVVDQMKANSFDQVYHEHLSYLSIHAMDALLKRTNFRMLDIMHYPIHGGAIMIVLQKYPQMPVQPRVQAYLDNEHAGLPTWTEFSKRSKALIHQLGDLIRNWAQEGKRVVGYGASAKSTVWINAMGLTNKELKCVYDCTPQKLYRYVPGTNIPIAHEGGIFVDNPDYAVCFAWNFMAEVLMKQAKWIRGGGQFVVPVPSIKLIGVDSLPPEE